MRLSLKTACLLIVLCAASTGADEHEGTDSPVVVGYRALVTSSTPASSRTRAIRRAGGLLPLAVAKDRGLFAKHRVDVRLEASARAHFHDCDVLYDYPYVCLTQPNANPENIRFTLSCAMTADGDTIKALLVKKEAGIEQWLDFKGKQIVVPSMDEAMLFWLEIEPKLGLGRGDLKLKLLHGDVSTARFLADSQLHAFYCYKATMREMMQRSPKRLSVFATNLETRFLGNPYYSSCVILNWKRCQSKQETLSRLITAFDQAIDFIRAHPDECVGALSTLFEGVDRRQIKGMGVPYFQKSSELCDFKALKQQYGRDLQSYYWKGEGLNGM